MGSYRGCSSLKEERISKSSGKTIRYSTASRAGLVTSLEPAIVRVIMREKSTKLSEIKALCPEGKGWKDKEDREKGRGKRDRRGRGRGKEEEEGEVPRRHRDAKPMAELAFLPMVEHIFQEI